jgi:hypothetical protein
MRRVLVASLIAAIAIALGCARGPRRADPPAPQDRVTGTGIDSGIYGFAGAHVGEGADEGVIGECIWVFDARDRRQIAKGECGTDEPGRFRLALRPGKYVVHGPGGNHPIEVKRGQWTRVMSLVELPVGP